MLVKFIYRHNPYYDDEYGEVLFFFIAKQGTGRGLGYLILLTHRLRLDQQYKDDELQAAIDIIEFSKDGLESSIRLFETK